MIRRQPRPKRTETRLPYTTRFRSVGTARKGRSIWVMTSRYRRGGARPPVLEAPARPGHLIGVRDTFRHGRDERIPHGGSAVGAGRAVRRRRLRARPPGRHGDRHWRRRAHERPRHLDPPPPRAPHPPPPPNPP